MPKVTQLPEFVWLVDSDVAHTLRFVRRRDEVILAASPRHPGR